MEIYYEPDERIIATTIPPFDRKKTSQIQMRIKGGGAVIYREFQRKGLEFEQIREDHSTISREAVADLISTVAGLMKLSASMPVIDDSGSRRIDLHHADGSLESIQFPNGGGRKHPGRHAFEDVWQVIEASVKHNSEQDTAGQSATVE